MIDIGHSVFVLPADESGNCVFVGPMPRRSTVEAADGCCPGCDPQYAVIQSIYARGARGTRRAVNQLKSGKAPGGCDFYAEMLKAGEPLPILYKSVPYVSQSVVYFN